MAARPWSLLETRADCHNLVLFNSKGKVPFVLLVNKHSFGFVRNLLRLCLPHLLGQGQSVLIIKKYVGQPALNTKKYIGQPTMITKKYIGQ